MDRAGLSIFDFVTRSRESKTGKQLWNKVKQIDCDLYSSDDLKAYKKVYQAQEAYSF